MSNLNVRQSLSLTSTIRNPITKAARNPARSKAAPLLSDRPLSLHSVTSGFNDIILPTDGGLRDGMVIAPPVHFMTTTADLDPNRMLVDDQLPNSNNPQRRDDLDLNQVGQSHQSLPTQPLFAPLSTPSATNHSDTPSIIEILSHARVMAAAAQRQPSTARPSTRQARRCAKCGRIDCSGRQSRKYCRNGCQDCGSPSCKGRNTKRPSKPCHEGWL